MTTEKAYHIAGLNLRLYIGDQIDLGPHIVCNGYKNMDESGKKMLQEIAGLIYDAIETCTHTQATSIENTHDDTSRYNIFATNRDVLPKVIFDIADYTLGKLLPQHVDRAQYKVSAVSKLRKSVREADAHEINTLRTALRGNINAVFNAFKTASKKAGEKSTDATTTSIQKSIAEELNEDLRDKLVHREILDYVLGDSVMEALLELHNTRMSDETPEAHIQRTAVPVDQQLKQKILAFLMEENIGEKSNPICGYLTGELATAIEAALEKVNKTDKTKAKTH